MRLFPAQQKRMCRPVLHSSFVVFSNLLFVWRCKVAEASVPYIFLKDEKDEKKTVQKSKHYEYKTYYNPDYFSYLLAR